MVNMLLMNAVASAARDVASNGATQSSSSSSASGDVAAASLGAAKQANLSGSFLLSRLAQDQPNDFDMPWIVKKVQDFVNHIRSNPSAKRKLYITLGSLAAISLALQYYQAKRKRQYYDELNKLETEKSKHGAKKGTAAHTGAGYKSKTSRVAVDSIFFARLFKILKIAVPGFASAEFADIMILTALLVSRTMFSIYIAELVGLNAQSMVSRRWNRLFRGIGLFAIITIPAAAINSGLKYYQEIIALRFRVRLSEYVHDEYLEGVNFYKASNLSTSDGGRIENADQRVTADIANFSDEIAKLYASSLKPLLDVMLFTYKLGTIVGWQGPACMHLYFAFSAFIKKRIMPNLGKLVARESELEGYYRTAHNRVITNSEEIAFYNGASKEKTIINHALHQIYEHVSFHRYIRALIGIFDQLLIKYYASIAGYITLTAPLLFNLNNSRRLSSTELTRDYIRNSQYLGNLSTAVSDLIVVSNKLVSIAGYTSRVSELLEQVKLLKGTGNKPFTLKENVDSAGNGNGDDEDEFGKPSRKESLHQLDGVEDWIKQWKRRCDDQQEERYAIRESMEQPPVLGGGTVKYGSYIEFKNVDIVSPEGKLLVKQLNFRVDPGVNVMITGPNGVGKSSLFRVIGNLWPLHNGELVKPHNADVLFVPQKPYLVLGTLRDQVIYPHSHADMKRLGVTDEDLAHLLAIVDPAQYILTEWKLDTVKDWFHAFSGGQKQRVAMARLFYHRPRFAILDECTSAVSDEVEDVIYSTCRKLGITIFTVSHRPNLARHHDIVLRFEGVNGAYTIKKVTDQEKAQAQRAIERIKAASASDSSPTTHNASGNSSTKQQGSNKQRSN